MAKSTFRPLHDRVVVKRLDAEEKTKGGIIIPDTAKEKPSQGEITAVGPGGRDEPICAGDSSCRGVPDTETCFAHSPNAADTSIQTLGSRKQWRPRT